MLGAHYFILIWLVCFCQIPTISDDINAGNTGLLLSLEVYEPGYVAPRTTLKETYDQILKDFDTAIPLLTKRSKQRAYQLLGCAGSSCSCKSLLWKQRSGIERCK